MVAVGLPVRHYSDLLLQRANGLRAAWCGGWLGRWACCTVMQGREGRPIKCKHCFHAVTATNSLAEDGSVQRSSVRGSELCMNLAAIKSP